MSRALPAALLTHLGLDGTGLILLWKATRRDGTVLGFTDHDADVSVNADGAGSVTYKASTSFIRSAIAGGEALEVVTLEIEGGFDAAGVAESDAIGGKFRHAQMKLFVAVKDNVAATVWPLTVGRLGEVELTEFGFKTDFSGLLKFLQRNLCVLAVPRCMAPEFGGLSGRYFCGFVLEPGVWTPTTAKVLGDAVEASPFNNRRFRCTTAGTSGASQPSWNLTIGGTTNDGTVVWTTENAVRKTGTVATVTSRKQVTISGITEAVDGYFDGGLWTFTSGTNNGLSREIKSWTAAGALIAILNFPFTIAVSDGVKLIRGCDRRLETCRDTYNWVAPPAGKGGFRGVGPWVPGQDATLKVN